MIHESSNKLLYSNVNLKSATHMTPFATDTDTPDTLAIASDEGLVLGTIDEVRGACVLGCCHW